MTLVPDRAKLLQATETNLDATIEQELLLEMRHTRKSTDELKGQLSEFRQALMGAPMGETAFGRLPMVERRLSDLDGRVEVLELAHLRVGAYGAVASRAGHFLAAMLGGCITLLANVAIKLVWWHR